MGCIGMGLNILYMDVNLILWGFYLQNKAGACRRHLRHLHDRQVLFSIVKKPRNMMFLMFLGEGRKLHQVWDKGLKNSHGFTRGLFLTEAMLILNMRRLRRGLLPSYISSWEPVSALGDGTLMHIIYWIRRKHFSQFPGHNLHSGGYKSLWAVQIRWLKWLLITIISL